LCNSYLHDTRSKLIPLRIAIDGEEIGVLTSGYYYTIPKLPGKLRIDVLLGNSASVDTISLIIEAGKDYYFRIRQYSRSSASIDYIPNSLGITESAGCKLAGELPQQPKIEAEKAPEIAATTYQLESSPIEKKDAGIHQYKRHQSEAAPELAPIITILLILA
jgi:hypothetical protein